MSTTNEQKLVDLCFEIALTLSEPFEDRAGEKHDLSKLSRESKADWIAKQLRSNGFDTQPCGGSFGILSS